MAQRADLLTQMTKTKHLAAAALLGGLIGSLLLELTPNETFLTAVPWLILLSCCLLIAQNKIRTFVRSRSEAWQSTSVYSEGGRDLPVGLYVAVFLAAIYGGFFGAGLGIMLLAFLGLFTDESLARSNALKQALYLVINLSAAILFAATGHVRWELVPIMAVAALVGGKVGGRLSRIVNPTVLRWAVITFGLAVAVRFFVS